MSNNKLPAIKLCNQSEKKSEHLSRRQFLQNSTGSLLAMGVAAHVLPGSVSANPQSADSRGYCAEDDGKPANRAAQNRDMRARYQRARTLQQGRRNNKIGLNSRIYPHWIGDSSSFWYRRDTKSGAAYKLVDAATASSQMAFDHGGLAAALAQQSGEKVNAVNLPITDVEITLSPRTVTFSAFDKSWLYDNKTRRCSELATNPSDWRISPDGKKAAFVRDYNLWMRDFQTGNERPLTTDGEKFRVYAATSTVFGRDETPSVEAIWSPDSRKILTLVKDTRNVKIAPPLVKHVPEDGSLRPTILRPDRRLAFSEDEEFEGYQFLAIDVVSGAIQNAEYRKTPVFYPPYVGFFTSKRGWWSDDNCRAWFLDEERGGKVARLLEFDTQTGRVRVVIEEKTDTLFNFVLNTHLMTLTRPLPGSNEVVWYSDRSSWGHLYLYDTGTGKLKNAITQGDWVVRGILHYDDTRREMVIQTSGRIAGRNPYYCDICRVNIDNGELTPLLSTDHEYLVADPRSRFSFSHQNSMGVSPDGRYVVTTRTRVDQLSETMLLDRHGNKLLDLEATDETSLPENWYWPEPVMLKAADGKTDVYTIIFRPSDFSPNKSYPVIDCSFGYLSPIGSFGSDAFGSAYYLSAAAIAELGFIVVMTMNRGNDVLRGKAFKDYLDPVLPLNPAYAVKYNMADCVAAIKQLAKKYSYIDIERVGVSEFGSVPSAVAGMFLYPDFYKVGVAMFPCTDTSMVGSMGQVGDDFPALDDMADNLQGRLFLIHGMLDNVIPVANTFRIVEALQKANKSFDMLLLPNMGHGASLYAVRRQWDYLVKHLLYAEPPENFNLAGDAD